MLGTTVLAFLLGISGVRPSFPLATVALAAAILKGWDDLLFLRNWGGGIPFSTTSFFVNKNLFTLILSPALLLLVGAVFGSGAKPRKRWWLVSILVAGFLLLLVSDGRGALMGFGAGGILLAILSRWGVFRNRGIGILVAVALVLSIGWGFRARVPQTIQEIEAIVRFERVTTMVPDRFRPWVWTGSLRLWEEAPWTGIGVGVFRYRIESALDPWLDMLRDRRMKVDVAHSHWLQTSVERGMVGLALESALFLMAFAGAVRNRCFPLASALAAMAVHALVGEGFEYPMGAVLWWYLIGHGATLWVADKGIGSRIPAVCSAILLAYPFWMQVRTARGEALIADGAISSSVEVLTNAVGLAPGSPLVLVEVSRYQSSMGDLDEARRTLERLRILYPWPASTGADLPLSHLWIVEGRLDSASSLLGELVDLYPKDPAVLNAMVRLKSATDGCESALAFKDSVHRELMVLTRPGATTPWKSPPWWVGLLVPAEREHWREKFGERERLHQVGSWKEWIDLRLPECQR